MQTQSPLNATHMRAPAPEPSTPPSAFFRQIQAQICAAVESLDGEGRFQEDTWVRPAGGGGASRVLQGGRVFEKAGVNWSEVHGEMDPDFAARLPGDGRAFHACGVSLVFHPQNPHVPAVHANFRALTKGDATWFGGGADLTPYYPRLEDAQHFHRTLKGACDTAHPGFYSQFKTWCDAYFYLPHRGETRGIGGIFFDYLGAAPDAARVAAGREAAHLWPETLSLETAFAFVREAAESFVPAYLPIAQRRSTEPFTPSQREFQLARRNRYAEFNLLYDRGTVFGLRTGGRVESILMSMPPLARWDYAPTYEPGSPEATLPCWLAPHDWLSMLAPPT